MATLEELKHKAKTTAMVAALSASSVAQAQGMDSSLSEKELTKTELKQDAQRASIICENPEIYLEIKEKTGQNLVNQLNSPVTEDSKKITEQETAIGPFPGIVIDIAFEKNVKKYKSDFKTPEREIEREIREVNSGEDMSAYDNMAYYDFTDKKVHMPIWSLSEEVKSQIKTAMPDTWAKKLMTGDVAAEIAAERHENAHFLHDTRGQTDLQKFSSQTSDMFVEKDYTTEKVAYAVQNLTLANIWKHCNDAGMKTIEIDGEQKPISEILSQTPGLKEEIEKNGFDPKSEESCSRIVKLASAHWDDYFLSGYSSGQFATAAQSGYSSNIMNQIKAARDQQKMLKDMTKNLDIGYNTKINIPDDCIDLMMPKKEITQKIVQKENDFSPSTEGLLAIDKYLDERGLKNDKEKDEYLKEQYKNIVNRSNDADLKLKELMLACGNKDSNMIYYTDNLQVKEQNGIQTVSNDLGKTTYVLNPMDQRKDLAQTNDKTFENTENKKETKTLTVAEISAALQRQGR